MSKLREFLKNFSYTLGANIVSTVIGAVILLIIPAFMGVKEYGYWQLYLFYEGYTAYLSLGLSDGAYVKYGGWQYQELKKPFMVMQFWFLVFFNLLALICVCFWAFFKGNNDVNKSLIIVYAFISSVIVVPRLYLILVMQTTNRIREYSVTLIIERVIYLLLVLGLVCIGDSSYISFIWADLIGKIVSIFYAIRCCKELVFGRVKGCIKQGFKEIKDNISIGIKIVVAGVVGSLIIGIVRFVIESKWDVETFAKVSLSLSVSNMIMKFITAIAVVLFPMICRIDKEKLREIYMIGKKALCILIFFGFIFYYPIKSILSLILPQYAESLNYMALLFPICIYECKMQLLGNTYFKALRKEKYILQINLAVMMISMLLSFASYILDLPLVVLMLTIVLCLALRTIISDIVISKNLALDSALELLVETIMVVMFIICNWLIGGVIGFFIYLIIYGLYLFYQRKYLLEVCRTIKNKIFIR